MSTMQNLSIRGLYLFIKEGMRVAANTQENTQPNARTVDDLNCPVDDADQFSLKAGSEALEELKTRFRDVLDIIVDLDEPEYSTDFITKVRDLQKLAFQLRKNLN